MSRAGKISGAFAVIAGVIAVAFWVSADHKHSSSLRTETSLNAETATTKTSKPSFFTKHITASTPVTNSSASPDTSGITDWESKLDEVLREDGETDEKGRKLLEMFPRLPADGQEEVAPHIANLISDEDFPRFGAYLTNAMTSAEVRETIMADLQGRPNAIKLPLLLEVARTSGHEKAGEAKELLELYLEKDYGDHWEEWDAKIKEWLKENPD